MVMFYGTVQYKVTDRVAWVCRQAYLVLAGVCVLVGATTTYGLAGDLRHAPPARATDNGGLEGGGWQFFQPFR